MTTQTPEKAETITKVEAKEAEIATETETEIATETETMTREIETTMPWEPLEMTG